STIFSIGSGSKASDPTPNGTKNAQLQNLRFGSGCVRRKSRVSSSLYDYHRSKSVVEQPTQE
ncbi:MAG: hypothetical protein ABI614_07435, partial [Planctomycetota bacterium]